MITSRVLKNIPIDVKFKILFLPKGLRIEHVNHW